MKSFSNFLKFSLLIIACNNNPPKSNEALNKETLSSIELSGNSTDTITQVFQYLDFRDIDQITMTDSVRLKDTLWSGFQRYLTPSQIQNFCELMNSVQQFDTFIRPSTHSTYSLLVNFKRPGPSARFNVYGNTVSDYAPVPGMSGYKKLQDIQYFSTLWNNSYEPPCNCEILLDPAKSPFDRIVQKQNITLSQCGTILKDSAEYFFLSIFQSGDYNDVIHDSIWIKKSDNITTYIQTMSLDTIILFAAPYTTSGTTAKVPAPDNTLNIAVTVTNCYKQWVKVRFILRKKQYHGWLRYYCSNPYTTCT